MLSLRLGLTDARHLITKRNYSDQSIRGYLTEVNTSHPCENLLDRFIKFLPWKLNCCRGLAGGTRCARRSSTANSAVAVQSGLTAVHQVATTMRTAASPKLDTSGASQRPRRQLTMTNKSEKKNLHYSWTKNAREKYRRWIVVKNVNFAD